MSYTKSITSDKNKNAPELDRLEERIGYHFRDRSLLETALTHSSYANEHKHSGVPYNERLEYLGDAVLDLVCADYLFHGHPEMPEGELSKNRASMVSETPLSACARELGIPGCLRLGRGEEQMGGRNRKSIVADAAEAVIGAVYLDGGFGEAKKLVMSHFLTELRESDLFTDLRTPLQEYFQDQQKKIEYRLTDSSGPPHDPIFSIAAYVDGELIGEGQGRSKKAAAQSAARDALERLHVSEIN